MIRKQIDYFNVAQIAGSGQCFRMVPEESGGPAGPRTETESGWYRVISGEHFLRIRQENDIIEFDCPEAESGFWQRYFDLDTDYGAVIQGIPEKDRYLTEAARAGQGIRILRQDLWEMIVSFLISQQNNIPRIRRCIENLCRTYGKRKEAEGFSFYTFPGPEVLAGLEEDALKPCNLGYRSKYVVRTARQIYEGGFSLEKLRDMEYEGARQELMKLFGVGEKVADCICLFALHHLAAFPVDTHIRQALAQHYPQGFPREKCRGREGIFQQYIFYYELHKERER